MKYLYPLFTFIFISFYSSAQFENNDLTKYKLPDIKRHQLDFNIGANGNKLGVSEFSISEFVGNGELRYSFYRNSLKFQTQLYALTSLAYTNAEQSRDEASEQDESEFNSGLSFNYDVQYYPGNNNWFLSVHPVVYTSYSKENDRIANEKDKDAGFDGSLGIGGGKGRIEQVQDFRHALLLMQELNKRGVLKRNLSETELLNLANLISELQNKRVFDARKRKEKDLIAIDSFLVKKDIINKERSIAYFVGLEDIWRFGSLQIRESGNKVELYASPGYDVDKGDFLAYDYKLEIFKVDAVLNYSIRKPISIKWQSDFNVGIDYTYSNILLEENISTGATKHYKMAYMDGNLGFFPNTRTSLYAWAGLSLRNGSNDGWIDNENYTLRYRIGSSLYYYISERLRLDTGISYFADVDGVLNKELENNSAYKRFFYHLKFNYAIF